MIIMFCGHSDYVPSEEDGKKILSLLEEKIGERDAELYLGGYGGFDAFAEKCGREYQRTHPNTKLIFVTPYMTENRLVDAKLRYDDVIYPELERVPPRFAISHRNKWMAEKADCVIAYVNHAWGGAYQTYQHAKKKQKEICNLTEKIL